MDPRDPSQRPSIFPTKDLPYEPRPPVQPVARAPQLDRHATQQPLRAGARSQPGPSRGLLFAFGGGAVMLLVVGGFVVASLLGPDAAPALGAALPSPEASASIAVGPTPTPSARPSPTPAATPSPTPLPTPSPTPAGPPQEVALGGWATVAVDELNVRAAPDEASTSNYALVRGAVLHVAEGPVTEHGLNWYRIASLGGAAGWAASGWQAEPFMTTLVDDSTLVRCGEVQRPVFDVIDGELVPHDPLAIGDLALPVAAFSDATLGAMELLRGVGDEACFSALVGADGAPTLHAQISANACGRPVSAGDFFRLRPAAGQNVPPEIQIKDPVVVHPAVLIDPSAVTDDLMSAAVRTVVSLTAAAPDASGCVYVNVVEDPGSIEISRVADTTQCFVVHEHVGDSITINAAAGGDPQRLALSAGESLAIGVPTLMSVGANHNEYGRFSYAYPAYETTCG